jgi:hypothetical protein
VNKQHLQRRSSFDNPLGSVSSSPSRHPHEILQFDANGLYSYGEEPVAFVTTPQYASRKNQHPQHEFAEI